MRMILIHVRGQHATDELTSVPPCMSEDRAAMVCCSSQRLTRREQGEERGKDIGGKSRGVRIQEGIMIGGSSGRRGDLAESEDDGEQASKETPVKLSRME